MKSEHSSWRDKALCASLLTAICVATAYGIKKQFGLPAARADVVQLQNNETIKSDCLSEVVRQERVIIEQVEQTHQLNKGLEDLLNALREGEGMSASTPTEGTY